MKYLRKFNTEADKAAWREGDSHVTPNVVLTEGAVDYNVSAIRKGVFIQHINGKLYTEEGWTNGGFSNDEANGVAVLTEKASFVIAKTDLGGLAWASNTSTSVNGILTTEDGTTALTDFAGYDNTQLMIAIDTSGAGYSCANFTFPNGDKGYLSALGELNEAYANKSKIDSLMNKIGGTALASDTYWSSSQYSFNRAWTFSWTHGGKTRGTKSNAYRVRAFSALPL